MPRVFFLSFAAVLLLIWQLPAAAAPSDTHIADMQRAYAAMNAFSSTFTQELYHAESGAVEKRNGTLLFQKPLHVRWETTPPYPELMIVNDKEVWDYLPDEAVAYMHPIDIIQDSRTMLQVVTGQSRLDKDFTVQREDDKGGFISLHLFPKEPTTQMVEARILVDPSTYLLKSAELTDFYGNTNKVEFQQITKNPSFPSDTFTFDPPENVIIEKGAPENELRR